MLGGWLETLSLAPHPRAGPQSTAAIHFIIELDTAVISRLEKQRKDLLKNGLIFLKVIDHLKMRVLVKSNKGSAMCELAPGHLFRTACGFMVLMVPCELTHSKKLSMRKGTDL